MMVPRLSGGRGACCCRAEGRGPSPQCTLSLGLPLRTRRQDTSSVGTLPPERVLFILQKAAKSTEQFLCGEQWGSHVRTGPCGHPQDKA